MIHASTFPSLLLTWAAFFSTATAADLQLTEDDQLIRITLRGNPVLEYVKTEKPVPEGVSPDFRRSGYIHPVYSPQGQEVTGDFPHDHAHQHALFFAWTRTHFDGKKIDFWNQAKKEGGVEHRAVESITREDDRVAFTVKHAFVAGRGEQRVDVLNETWTVTVYKTPDDYFQFDIESVQTCASDKPLLLPKYRYGGMALRGNIQWLGKENDFRFLTNEGKDRLEGNHTRPNWVAMSGLLDGQAASITAMGSPKNFRAPQPVRIHPDKPYFCFAPMVTDAFRIEPGKPYVSRYRYLVRSAPADTAFIEKHWQAYAGEESK